tara:strand:+ start:322 stop:558 length:237 start_codon:yes stop_codon:yes gene_type:complete
MIRSDEDDEFDRIERENAMKGQPYLFKHGWVNLTDKEILTAYGWSNEELKTDDFVRAKTLILEGLRRIETAIREKNNV